MQPLDYTFFIIIGMTISYYGYVFWKEHFKINTKTIPEDQLIHTFTALQHLRKRRQDYTRRFRKEA